MNKFTAPMIILLIMLVVLIPYFAQNTSLNSTVSIVDPVIPTLNVGVIRLDPVYRESNKLNETLPLSKKEVIHSEKGMVPRDTVAEIAKQVSDNIGGHLGNQTALIHYKFEDLDTKASTDGVNAVSNINKNKTYGSVSYWVTLYNNQAFNGNLTPNNLKPNAASVSSTRYTSVLFTEFAKKKVKSIEFKPVDNSDLVYDDTVIENTYGDGQNVWISEQISGNWR